ncbi:MAG: GxGYxYP domain-containing protein [Ktedonobacterales bacterium]
MLDQDSLRSDAAAPRELELLQLEGLRGDEKLLATALQGLINRTYPRLYLLHGQQDDKDIWLQEFGRPYLTHEGVAGLLDRHPDVVKGLIIYDPAMPDSINVAVTLAGLEQGLPASPALAGQLSEHLHQLPVLVDLRGQFSSRLQAYTWQFATLWPRCAHDILVGISPTRGEPPTPYGGLLQDYAVSHRAMVFWLDPNQPEERTLFEAILQDVAPCSPYLGWFPRDVAGEFSGTELTSAHSVYVLAADHSSNLTTFSERRPAPSSISSTHTSSPRLENKIYVTFTLSEGDNLQYMQHRMRYLWDDPGRGQVPINWSINPLALDLAPTLLNFYLRTRTPEDCLIAGPSGAGYCYPSAWPETTFSSFTHQTAGCMSRLGLEVIWILNRAAGKSIPLDRASAGAYLRDISPLGILLNYESYTETSVVYDYLPQAITQGVASVEDVLGALGLAGLLWDGTSPLFLSLGLLAWTITPSDVAGIVARFTPPYQAVRADEYFRLVRQAHGLP